MYLVCALVPLGTGWEAGEMPALPRNCKRVWIAQRSL
jgi:hypothetical protein